MLSMAEKKGRFWPAEARFDWRAYVVAAGGVRTMTGKPEYQLSCPDCRKLKISVNTERRAWRCFTCGVGGFDAASLIAKIEGLSFGDALTSVMAGHQRAIGRIDQVRAHIGGPPERPPVTVPSERSWPVGFMSLSGFAPGVQPTARDYAWWTRGWGYCSYRNIPTPTVQAMRIGLCRKGRFRNRLIFPTFDSGGRLVFYQGRAMWTPNVLRSRHIKTLSPKKEEGFAGASDVLLNLEWLERRQAAHRVLVVEGPVDCAHAWPDAVCSFGKHLSDQQVSLLVRAGTREIDLGFDPEEMTLSEQQAAVLADVFTVRVVRWPAGKDPGDLTKTEIEQYRAQARPWGSGARLDVLNNQLH